MPEFDATISGALPDWPIEHFMDSHLLRLVLVGGGSIPEEALERFVSWAGGRLARIVVIPWASALPEESFRKLEARLTAHAPLEIVCAPDPSGPSARETMLTLLSSASGVFFGGGDQVKLMAAIDSLELAGLLRERALAGCVYGGTSAGTAIMSERMITGRTDPASGAMQVKPGLGLVRGAVVDQHFIVRARLGRLLCAMTASSEYLGLGIDEDSAMAIAGNRFVEVLGSGKLVLADSGVNPGRFTVDTMSGGQIFDMAERSLSVPLAWVPRSDEIGGYSIL